MHNASTDNKRIAKNTIYLYLRKIISIFLAFYAARLLLKALGVEDYGLYGLIGSVLAIFSSLRSLFSSSIQRYISIAKGSGENRKVQIIFSMGVKIHLWISVIFFILAEIGGFLIIPHLNISSSNIVPAHWIWQFSVLTTIVTIMTVPYDALIIANERFDAYALFAVIESILRFAIVLLLFLDDGSRVVLYAVLMFFVSLLVRLLNWYYCKKHFGDEAKYCRKIDKTVLKEMSAFAGWQFFGNMGYALQNSGSNIVLNLFGGTIANAARSIAYQVMGSVAQFIGDINVSFQPRTMMEFSKGNIIKFYQLLFLSAKTTFLICGILAFPIIMFTPSILSVWLNEVPDNSIPFIRWIMIYIMIRSLHSMFDLFFKTCGRLKKYQTWEFFCLLSNVPLSWFSLKIGFPLWSVFCIMSIVELINLISIAVIASQQCDFEIKRYLKCIVVRVIFAVSLLYASYVFINFLSPEIQSSFQTIVYSVCSASIAFVIITLTVFSRNELAAIIQLIKNK